MNIAFVVSSKGMPGAHAIKNSRFCNGIFMKICESLNVIVSFNGHFKKKNLKAAKEVMKS